MLRHPIITKDGSHTIAIPELNVTYHSIHGAIQESLHVFIEAGLNEVMRKNPDLNPIHILEIGFGTGLNALLTLIEAEKHHRDVYYAAFEPYPLSNEEVYELNYISQLDRTDLNNSFNLLHESAWETDVRINTHFTLHKSKSNLLTQFNFSTFQPFNLIYYDAFAPSAQLELWTQSIFEKLYAMTAADGILVTYCSKSIVRRAMQAAGFSVERIPGPWGKRQMLRATKLVNS